MPSPITKTHSIKFTNVFNIVSHPLSGVYVPQVDTRDKAICKELITYLYGRRKTHIFKFPKLL